MAIDHSFQDAVFNALRNKKCLKRAVINEEDNAQITRFVFTGNEGAAWRGI